MSAQLQSLAGGPRLAPADRARLAEIAAAVGRASGLLISQRRTRLDKRDLRGLGMLAVLRKLPSYDPERAELGRWAFYQAIRAMTEAACKERRETAFQQALRSGAEQYTAADDRPAEQDIDTDTAETDRERAQEHAQRLLVAAHVEAAVALERAGEGAPVELENEAVAAVHGLREEVARLSAEQQRYLRLRFWDDAEVKAVAAALNIPERTLRRRWLETRDLLEARLRARGITGTPKGVSEAAGTVAAARGEIFRDEEDTKK